WGLELDAVEAGRRDGERALEAAVRRGRERDGVAVVEDDASGLYGHGGQRADEHFGAAQHRDVSAVLDHLRAEPRVRGEAVLEVEPLDVGQVGDLDTVDSGAHTFGLDVVVGRDV